MNSCLLCVLKLKLIQIKKLKLNFRNNHKYVHISQRHFSSYYFEFLLWYHLYIFCYGTSRQHKKAEHLDIIQVLVLPCPWLRFMCLQTPATVKVKVLFSFKMISQQFCSFDNFNSLLWGYYSFSFWILLALKLTIRIIGRGDMVGEGWKHLAKLIMWYLC